MTVCKLAIQWLKSKTFMLPKRKSLIYVLEIARKE